MATFFGEVLPIFSRAVDSESEDEDGVEETQTREPFPCLFRNSTRGFVFCGPVACGFAKLLESYLRAQKYKITGCETFHIGHKAIAKLEIENVLEKCAITFVMLDFEMNTQEEFDLTQEMFGNAPNLELEITILCSCHVSEYKCSLPTSQLAVPFIRKVSTTRARLNSHQETIFHHLETPNFLTRLPANLMTFCQIRDIRASTYVLFTDVSRIDSINLEPFVATASNLLGNCINLPDFQKHFQGEINRIKQDAQRADFQSKPMYI